MITADLWAKSGTITMPDGMSIPAWGYSTSPDGSLQVPGPVIEAFAGEVVNINLHNALNEPVSIVFPGQEIKPQPVKGPHGTYISYNSHAGPGETVSYSFTAQRPGAYLYESGSNPGKQIQMGLHGSLIIRPPDYDESDPRLRTAYGAETGSEFDVEQILLLNEVDSRLHVAVSENIPYNLAEYHPNYWTINGRAYPLCILPADTSAQPYSSRITANTGERVLIRCINAGFQHHNLRFDCLFARIIAIDSFPLRKGPDRSYQKNTITIGSGETYDVIIEAQLPGKYIIYDRDCNHSTNAGSYPGGIMTILEVI